MNNLTSELPHSNIFHFGKTYLEAFQNSFKANVRGTQLKSLQSSVSLKIQTFKNKGARTSTGKRWQENTSALFLYMHTIIYNMYLILVYVVCV